MYKRPGGEDHEHLVDFLNEMYVEIQAIKTCLDQLQQPPV